MKWESAPPFEFEVNGKTYTVTPIGERGYTEYLDWMAIIAGQKDAPSATDEGPLLLGGAYQQMLDDKVPASAIRRALVTVITDLRIGREAAEQVWDRGLDPELLAPTASGANTAGSTQSSSTGEASETPRRASSTTTSSRKTTKRTAGKGRKSVS